MIAGSTVAMLVCVLPMPLAAGQDAKDRDIAVVRTPLPDAMAQSLQGPAPLSTQRFVGEAGDRHEWIVANPAAAGQVSKMLRLTRWDMIDNPLKARFGDATLGADGAWQFKLVAEGGCRLEAVSATTGKPTK